MPSQREGSDPRRAAVAATSGGNARVSMVSKLTHRSTPSRLELIVLLVLGLGLVVWALLPVIEQSQAYHQFADRRWWLAVPNAADVLSNLAFVLVGLLGLWRLGGAGRSLDPVVRASLLAFFLGLLLTGFGSGYYHWAPSDWTLVLDRLPMTIAFAGVFGALLAERVSPRSGALVLGLMLLLGPFSVLHWLWTGDLALYVVIQFGGIAALIALLLATPKGQDSLPWWPLLLWYGVAKVAEAADQLVWAASGELLAGHALKHIAAAVGGLIIALALGARAKAR